MSLSGSFSNEPCLTVWPGNYCKLIQNGLLVSFCLLLFACEKGGNSSNNDTGIPDPTTQTIANNHGPRVTIGVDGVTNQTAVITNPDNSVTDVTQDSTWVSADENVAIVLEPGLIQGVSPGSTTVDVVYNGSTIDTVEVIVLAVIPADITWTTLSDWVAYKDGATGPWTVLQRDVSGNYLFTVTDPDSLFAVAEMYQTPSGMKTVDIAYLKVDDLTNNTLVTNSSSLASNVTINITGTEATDQGFLTSYDIMDSQHYWSPTYDLDLTPTGFFATTSDLLANIFETDATGNRTSVLYYRENDVVFSDGFNTTIDIRGPLSFTPDVERNATVVGLNGGEDYVHLDVEFATANGSLLNIARYHLNTGYDQQILGPVAMRYSGFPFAQVRAGDSHRITAKAGYLDGVEVRHIISAAVTGDYTITLPQPMLATDFTWEFLNTGPNLTSRFSWNAHLDAEFGVADYYSVLLRHITIDVSWNIKIDPIWLDPAAMTIDTPDFSGLPGWDPAFNISEGFATYARLRAYHSNVSDTELLRDGLMDGVTVNQLSLSQTLFP